jgi:aryl-alcohol dehydrogenase-like predicted oxidoreductase
MDLAREHRWEPFVCLQPLYNLLRRDAELELLPICRNEGLGVVCWSPLEGGWLSGKYRREMAEPPAGSRYADRPQTWQQAADERTWRVVEAVQAVADDIGRTPSQVALRWLIQQPAVTAPIVGVRSSEQLTDNLGAAEWSLEEQHLARLTEVSMPSLPYPYDLQRLPQFIRRT